MTVQSQTDSIGYDGPGSAFSIPFRFLSDGDIRITKAPADGSTPVTLTLTTDYTLVGARQQGGGTATLVVALVAGDSIVIDRGNMQRTQLIDYRANDPFPEEDAEDGLDRLTMLLQQAVLDGSARSLRLPVTGVDGSSAYQGNGNRIVDIADAVNPEDVPNLAQVTGLIGPGSGPFIQSGTGAVMRTYQDKARDTLCILDYVPVAEHAAILAGTSTFDATAYVQSAVNAATAARRSLYAPGHYRLTAPIVLVGSLTIVGDGNEMLINWLGDTQTRGAGSWFFLDHSGIGFFVNPSVHRTGITFERIGTYRTQPATSPGPFTPAAHDYDFSLKNSDVLFRDVSLLNPTKGILSWGGTRLSIERIRGEPLTVGIEINDAGDTCRVRDVHFWPFFSNSAAVRTWLRANAVALIMRDVDNPDISGMFTIGYADSVLCEPLAGTAAMPLKVRLSNFDFDNGGYGFRIASGGANGVTALLSHGYILGVSVGGPANGSNIDIGGNNNAVMIDNVGLDLPQDCNLKVSGTGNQVRASNLSVARWNFDAGASFGIEVGAGNILRLANPPLIGTPGTSTALFGGDGTISCPLGSGIVTQTTDASGFITVTHGLGMAPRVIVANGQSGTAYAVYPTTTKNATTFGAQLRLTTTGAAVASTSVTVEWHAFY